MRQCPSRDAFRAGRNLPDKEFRYLRTVIVTAAVHRGFSLVLAHRPLTFRHWAGITRYTSPYGLSSELWFWYPVAWAWFVSLLRARGARPVTRMQAPFFRRYGSNLPSSLTRGHSSTCVSSTCLPVSVCGTGTLNSPEQTFLGCTGAVASGGLAPNPFGRLSVNDAGICFQQLPTSFNGARLAAQRPPQHSALVKRVRVVQEYQPVVHRLRHSPAP